MPTRRSALEWSLQALIIIWCGVIIYSLFSQNWRSTRGTIEELVIHPGSISVKISAEPFDSLFEGELERDYRVVFYHRNWPAHVPIVEFLAYVSQSLAPQVAVRTFDLESIADANTAESGVGGQHISGIDLLKASGLPREGWSNCLLILGSRTEVVFLKLNVSKQEVALIVKYEVASDMLAECNALSVSTDSIRAFALGDSTALALSDFSHLMLYSSICSECGDGFLIDSLESIVRRGELLPSTNSDNRDLLILFPDAVDYDRLHEYVRTKFPLLSGGFCTFAQFDAPVGHCLGVLSLHQSPLLLESEGDGYFKTLATQEFVAMFEGKDRND